MNNYRNITTGRPVQIDGTADLHRIALILARLGSDQLATVITAGISILDHRAGDPDFEDCDTEDDHRLSAMAVERASYGAGCTVSDPDHEHDGAEQCTE